MKATQLRGRFMIDKRLVVGGFAAGVAIGLALLPVMAASNSPQAEAADALRTSHSENAGIISSEAAVEARSATGDAPTFREMVLQVQAAQGGVGLSLDQMRELAVISSRLNGNGPVVGAPTFQQMALEVQRQQGAGLSMDQAEVLAEISSMLNGNAQGYGSGPSAAASYGRRMPYSAPTMDPVLQQPRRFSPSETRRSRADRFSVLDDEDTSRSYSTAREGSAYRTMPRTEISNNGAINPATGEYFPRAGQGYVSSRNGTYYAPAGPNGVTNTRTGEFVPVGR